MPYAPCVTSIVLIYHLASRLAYVLYVGLTLRWQERTSSVTRRYGAETGFRRFRRAAFLLMSNDAVSFVALCLVSRRTLDLARGYRAAGVIGMGMAGEESYPLAPFAEVLDAATAAGVHLIHHAGEFGGPDSIREALQVGHAERLGHGIRALEDSVLVAELRARGVPLEVCPSSNVALGASASLASHPLPRLLEAGLVVTLNTDIPATIGTNLTQEYSRVRDTFGLDDRVLADLALASVDASFAPERTKVRLREAINGWWSQPPGRSGRLVEPRSGGGDGSAARHEISSGVHLRIGQSAHDTPGLSTC